MYYPSYTDELAMNYTDELYHHGIKGQKWGIRRYQNEDGSYTAEGRKKHSQGTGNIHNLKRLKYASAPGTSQRVRQKQKMFNAKINRSNRIGKQFEPTAQREIKRDYLTNVRRGKVAKLELKARHREAKEAYRKNKSKENLKALRSARAERLVKNGLLRTSNFTQGKYNNYRELGKGKVESALRSLTIFG